MLQIISKLFGGSKSEKDVKKIQHLVPVINGHFESYKSLSNDALRNKTHEFRDRIKNYLAEIDSVIAGEKAKAEALPLSELLGRDAIYQQIDKLGKDRDELLEKILMEILSKERFYAVNDELCEKLLKVQFPHYRKIRTALIIMLS